MAKTVIELPLNNWHSQRVVTQAIGSFLEAKGYMVNYHNIPVSKQWGALSRGAIHYQLEVWQPSMAEQFEHYVSQDLIKDIGRHEAVVREEWWFPSYVKKQCPGLPNWQALLTCFELFKAPFSQGKGVYYTGPWQYQDGHTIRALGLNFIIEHVPQEYGLTNKMLEAIEARTPLLVLNWTPNWSDVRAKGEFVEFPEFTTECESKAEWGVNPEMTMDCGNIKNGWLKKASYKQAQTQQPCIFQFMQNLSFNKVMLAEASAMIVFDKLTERQAVKTWRTLYQADLERWWPEGCMQH